MLKYWRYILTGVVLTAFLAGCDNDKDINTLVMGTSADYKPFEFYQDDKIVGFDIDVANAITERLGYKLKVIDQDFLSLIPALQSKRVDFVMSSINPTPERRKNIDFSKLYNVSGGAFVFYKGDNTKNMDNISDEIIYGVQQGTVFEEYLQYEQQKLPAMKTISLSKIPLLIENLKLGRVDAVLLDLVVAKQLVEQLDNLDMVTTEGFGFGEAIAFPQGSELVEPFNRAIDELEMEGTLQKLREKWFGEK